MVTGKKGHQRRTEKRACTNVAHKCIGTLMLWVLSNSFFCSVVHFLIRLARRATTQITGEQKENGIIASERGQQRRTDKRACTNVAHRYILCVVLAFLRFMVRAKKRSTRHTTFSPICGEKESTTVRGLSNERKGKKHVPARGYRSLQGLPIKSRVSERPSPLSVAGPLTLCMGHATLQRHTHLVPCAKDFSG